MFLNNFKHFVVEFHFPLLFLLAPFDPLIIYSCKENFKAKILSLPLDKNILYLYKFQISRLKTILFKNFFILFFQKIKKIR